MVNVLDAEFGMIIEVRVTRIKVRRCSGDGTLFDELVGLLFGVSRQLTITG